MNPDSPFDQYQKVSLLSVWPALASIEMKLLFWAEFGFPSKKRTLVLAI